MIRHILRITSILIFAIATFSVGHLSARSDSSSRLSPKRVFDAAYRSHSSTHKVIVQATEPALRDSILAAGGSVLEDYGAFALMQAPNDAAEQVALESISGSSVRDDMNALLLRTGAFDSEVRYS